jgi:hypothetical protein
MINTTNAVNEQNAHLKYSDIYTYFSRYCDVDCSGEEIVERTLFGKITEATEQVNLLASNFRALAMLGTAFYALNYKTTPEESKTLYDAMEYLKVKIRFMLQEQPWLMEYVITYSVEHFR